MGVAYTEFDSVVSTLVADVATKIDLSSDWADTTPSQPSTTTTGTSSTSVATINVTSATGFYVGQFIKITVSGVDYYRQVVSIAGLVLTLNQNNGVSTTAGSTVVGVDKILSCTTTDGAQMVMGFGFAGFLDKLCLQPYRLQTGSAAPTDPYPLTTRRCVYFHGVNSTSTTDVVHCLVSASKDALFIRLEGPRFNETNPDQATYGSICTYGGLAAIERYHSSGQGDVAPAVLFFAPSQSQYQFDADLTPICYVSRNHSDSASWVLARVGSPHVVNYRAGNTQWFKLNRYSAITGDEWTWPIIVSEQIAGPRGRLKTIEFVDLSTSDYWGDGPEPLGQTSVIGPHTAKYVHGGRSYSTSAFTHQSPLAQIGYQFPNIAYTPILAVPYS